MNARLSNHVLQSLASLGANTTRRYFLRAASLTAVAGMLLTALPRPAAAAPETPLRLEFYQIDCIHTSEDDDNADDPYVIMCVADISGSTFQIRTVRTPIYSGMDPGDFRKQPVSAWPLSSTLGAKQIDNASNLIVLIAVMESDGGSRNDTVADRVQSLLQNAAYTELSTWLPFYKKGEVSRSYVVARMINEMNETLQIGNGGDDPVGWTRELALSPFDLVSAQNRVPVIKSLSVSSSGGSSFELYFKLRP